MNKVLVYAWKIPLSLLFAFIIFGVFYDILFPYDGNSTTPVWWYHKRTEQEFYAHAAAALITSFAALISIWARLSLRYRLILLIPLLCYQIYLHFTVLPD